MKLNMRSYAILSLTVISAVASAQVAFNDFSSDSNSAIYGYYTGSGWTVSGAASGVGIFRSANQFVSNASGTLTDLILPMSFAAGSGTVDVSIVSDNSNAVGTVLETWTMGTTGSLGSWSTPNILAGDGSVALVSGTAYWVEVVTTGEANSTLWAAWNQNDLVSPLIGTDAYNTGSGWNYQQATLGAFMVDVKAAPEPASLIALGGIALGLLRRRAAK